MHKAYLNTDHIVDSKNNITTEGNILLRYFNYRAEVLFRHVEPNLMDRKHAKSEFEKLYNILHPKIDLPLNKQKGDKKHIENQSGYLGDGMMVHIHRPQTR